MQGIIFYKRVIMRRMTAKLSTQPYKGARDFYPEELQIRNYVFEKWRKVTNQFGFEEYDFPILEPFEIFAAKSGQELVNEQLFSFEDRGGRKVAVRPELTPGTVRMLAQRYNEIPKPVKWFMIGNNWRYERPQLGRGREFYQLEANIFGVADTVADFEIFSLIIAIMREFGANETMFELRVSDRRLLNALLLDTLKLETESAIKVRRGMDKFEKLSREDFGKMLIEIGLSDEQIKTVVKFMEVEVNSSTGIRALETVISKEILENNAGYNNLSKLFAMLENANIIKYCKFDPTIIRGFDYSDGLVYEVFDKNPNNRRSIFGGERFDKLIEIFGNYTMEATGFAMGDMTTVEFLKNWGLLPQPQSKTDYLITVWPSDNNTKFIEKSFETADKLREQGKNVFVWPESNEKIDKQLKYADKKQIQSVVIIGETELAEDKVTLKNLKERTQVSLSVNDFLKQA